MEKTPKIEVCLYCSGFDVNELKNKVKVKISCIGKCSKKNPELNGKVYGFLNGEFTVCHTKEAFFAKIDELDSFVPNSNKNPLVDAFLEHIEKWRDEHDKLREICLACQLTEELKWGQPCYTLNNNNIVIIGGFKNYIALSFFKGALLKDEGGILVRQTENVQAGRQLRFRSVKEIAEKETKVKAYIGEAIEIEKAGLKVPVEKKPELKIPDELQAKFDEAPAFKSAFYALTPGRQRGYIFHFTGAKQSATRASRIEKCMPKIFEGLGIDD
jgi:uncharacterized protein YdeI (YjbR/CyaY-like superfamily)